MSRFVLGALALIAAGWATSARAADIYGSRAPYTVNQTLLRAYSWAGPYLGVNLGYAWGSVANNPTKPSGFVGGVQAGYNWQNGALGVRCRRRHPGDRRRRNLRAVEIFQPLVRHGSRPRRLSRSTTSCSSAPAVSPSANCAPPHSALSESHTNAGWTLGAGAEVRLRPELERQDRIPLCRSGQQQLRHYRRVKRLPVRLDPRRRELSLLRNKETVGYQLPAAASRRDFFAFRPAATRARRTHQYSGRRCRAPVQSSQPKIQFASNASVSLR